MKKQIEALVSNALFAAMGLLSFMLLSRNCPHSLFGEWVLFVSFATFFDLVRFGFTRNAVVRLIAAATDTESSHRVNGAGLRAGFAILILISAIFYPVAWLLVGHVESVYTDFLIWYPLLGVTNLLWNSAMSWLQAKSRFSAITLLRSINMGGFIIGTLLLIHFEALSFANILIVFILSNLASSLYGLLRGWDSLRYAFAPAGELIREILSFGKYSVGATLGSSLLKSADSFIISLSPVLGVSGVAIYAIPFKIVEMLELPIRSIATVGYNHLSATVLQGGAAQFKGLITRYIIIMTAVTLPVIAAIALMPDLVLGILGGKGYAPQMDQMRIMLYLLLLYGIMLIPDRITGVTLEALGRPRMNMYKVLLMAFFNIVGDLVAVFVFQSLVGVVMATVLFVVIGVSAGYMLIPRYSRPDMAEFIVQFNLLRKWKRG